MRHLWRTREYRTVGGIAGYVVAVVVGLSGHHPSSAFTDVVLMASAGYFTGALLSELRQARRPTGVRSASLEPREVANYVPRWALRWLATVAGIAVALVFMRVALPRHSARGSTTSVLAIYAAVAVGVVALATSAANRIVRRPQPVDEPSVVGADDAVRSASVHALVGAGLALALLIVSKESWAVAVSTRVAPVEFLCGIGSVAAYGLAIASWTTLTSAAWQVRRAAVRPA
jgi:hypothetical protein